MLWPILWILLWNCKLWVVLISHSHTFRRAYMLISIIKLSIVLKCWRRVIINLFVFHVFLLLHGSLVALIALFLRSFFLWLFLLFILLIEIVHNVFIIAITFFKDTLDHALSISSLHWLFNSVWVSLAIILSILSSTRPSTIPSLSRILLFPLPFFKACSNILLWCWLP